MGRLDCAFVVGADGNPPADGESQIAWVERGFGISARGSIH